MKRLSYASFTSQCRLLADRYPLHLWFVTGREYDIGVLDLSSHLQSVRHYDGAVSAEYSVCYNDQYQAPQLFLLYYDEAGNPLDAAAVADRIGAPLCVRDHPYSGAHHFALADCQSDQLLSAVSDAHHDDDVAAWLSLTLSQVGLHLPLRSHASR